MITSMSVPLDQLNATSVDDFAAALANVYEHAPWDAAVPGNGRSQALQRPCVLCRPRGMRPGFLLPDRA
jgi:hypothetical protein